MESTSYCAIAKQHFALISEKTGAQRRKRHPYILHTAVGKKAFHRTKRY